MSHPDQLQKRAVLLSALPNALTVLRILAAPGLALTRPFSPEFCALYALCGVTDAADGWLARRLGVAGNLGARLDSAADLLFFACAMVRLLAAIWSALPQTVRLGVIGVAALRMLSAIFATAKRRPLAPPHTLLNKATGLAVFALPFCFRMACFPSLCGAACAVAGLAAAEELLMRLRGPVDPDARSLFRPNRP